jgi:hypothetical protein
VANLTHSLFGTDEEDIYLKARAFFEVFEDVPEASEHPELDSQEFFIAIMTKLKEIELKNNVKLESTLFDVLLRVVQRGLIFYICV